MLQIKGVPLCLIICFIICSCARQANITELVQSKKHDREGVYYIEYSTPQAAAPIDKTLSSLGYTVKEGYYWSGLEKKTDKYKFLWFYGDEYESLKEVRGQERQRDSLLSSKNMASFIEAQIKFPQFPIENPEQEALNYIQSMEDISLYHQTYGDKNLDETEAFAQKLVNDVDKLLLYRNTYGVSEFTESKIMGFLEEATVIEAKILVENFTDSKHLKSIELTHLSKSSSIENFVKQSTAKKHFNVEPSFPFENKKAVFAFRDKLSLKLIDEDDILRLTNSLYDLHIEKNISSYRNEYKKIDLIMEYAQSNVEWLGAEYIRSKEVSVINSMNKSKYGKLKYFDELNNEINKRLNQWAWKGGYTYGHKLIVIDSYKGSLRKEKVIEGKGSPLDNILFEKVDNMVFNDITVETEINRLSYIRLAGKYTIVKDKKERLPFHAIFKLDDKSKKYKLSELVLTDYGVYNTHYDGKKKNKYYFYDKSSGSLKRKGK